MSYQSFSAWSSQQSPITPFSPPNDPADPASQPISKEPPPQQLPASPPTSASPSHFDGSSASSPHLASAQLMSPATSPNDTVTQSPAPHVSAGLEPAVENSTRRTSSKHRLSQDDSDFEPSKRRRTDHDRIDPSTNSTQQTPQIGFAPFYRLSHTALKVSQPHPALNLLSLYGLDNLSASVARKDQATGEKINRLRKSYEGKIKDFPGKNKAIVKEGDFFNLLTYPEEEWDIHQVQGKEIANALSEDQSSLTDSFMAKLAPALSLSSGPLPEKEAEYWRNIIDLDNSASKGDKAPSNPKAKDDKDAANNQAASPTSEPLRPRRRGTKRNYHDESFEGYEESFDDLGDGMSIDDDDRKSSTSSNARRRKRRKDTGSASHFSGSLPQFSPTTVSVSR